MTETELITDTDQEQLLVYRDDDRCAIIYTRYPQQTPEKPSTGQTKVIVMTIEQARGLGAFLKRGAIF